MKNNDYRLALPDPVRARGTAAYPGMTMRDYFAEKAMQAMLTNVEANVEDKKVYLDVLSDFSYRAADAMLKARDAN